MVPIDLCYSLFLGVTQCRFLEVFFAEFFQTNFLINLLDEFFRQIFQTNIFDEFFDEFFGEFFDEFFDKVLLQMPQNLSAQFVRQSPNILAFNEKRLHYASVVHALVHSTDYGCPVRNRLHCTAKNQIPIPNLQVRLKHILSATSAQNFRLL